MCNVACIAHQNLLGKCEPSWGDYATKDILDQESLNTTSKIVFQMPQGLLQHRDHDATWEAFHSVQQ